MRELKGIIEKREWLSRVFFSAFRCAWIGGLVLSFLLIPEPFLVLSANGKKVFISLSEGEKIFYSYIHSYTLSPVEDCWIFKEGELYLLGERVFSGGAGNPSGDEGRHISREDGSIIFYDIWRELPSHIYIRVSEKYRNAISIRGEVYKLAEIFGDRARVKVSLVYLSGG